MHKNYQRDENDNIHKKEKKLTMNLPVWKDTALVFDGREYVRPPKESRCRRIIGTERNIDVV